jgi:rhamnosyl/mannosyltransferase
MKVLNIVKYYYPSLGGMETYVRQLCNRMPEFGVEPSILTLNHITRIQTASEKVEGVPVRRVACQFKFFSQPISFSFAKEMKRLVSEVDLVHLHSPFPNAEVFNQHITKPLVLTWSADPVNTRWKQLFPFFRPSLVRVLEKASKIILIGPNLLENSPSLHPYQHKCEIIPLAYTKINGSEPEATSRKRDHAHPTILFVGKLRKYKGVEYLIRSLQHIPDALLRVVGNGEELSNLRQLTSKLGLDTRVTFLLNISNQKLPVEYANADIFVLPSINASEAFGIVQTEAMAFGLPVINTQLPSSVPYVSLNEVTGITVPPCNPTSIASAVKRLWNEPLFYENCSRNALERAKLFTEEVMIKNYNDIYRKCI